MFDQRTGSGQNNSNQGGSPGGSDAAVETGADVVSAVDQLEQLESEVLTASKSRFQRFVYKLTVYVSVFCKRW